MEGEDDDVIDEEEEDLNGMCSSNFRNFLVTTTYSDSEKTGHFTNT